MFADVGAQSASVHVLGKGRRERGLPLWKPAAAALRDWMAERGDLSTPEVFVKARGDPLSRWSVAYILRRLSSPRVSDVRLAAGELKPRPNKRRQLPSFRDFSL